MLIIDQSSDFKRGVKRMKKRGKDMARLKEVMRMLSYQEKIPVKYQDHVLHGTKYTYHDLHIEPDWILIYRIENGALFLIATGSHSDLF